MEHPVHPIPACGEGVRRRRQLSGLGHVDLQHIGLDGELAGGALGERQPPTGSTQHHLGPFVLGDAGHRERQRRVGQHAGNQNPFSLE